MTLDAIHEEIGGVASAMLSGDLSFIEGARRLSSLSFKARLRDDPDLVVFIGIDSETDALPMGEVRKLWQPVALAKLQPEIERAEAWARKIGHAECVRLVQRFGRGQ